jgi:uncharacterized protein HemX
MSSPHDPRRGIQSGRTDLPRRLEEEDEEVPFVRRPVPGKSPWVPLGLVLGVVALLVMLGVGFGLAWWYARAGAMQAAIARAQAQQIVQQQAQQVQQLKALQDRLEQEQQEWELLDRMPEEIQR